MKFELLGWKCEGLRCPDFNFEIDKSGNVVGVRSRAPHPRLEKEAARVINMLPKMKPGRQRGKAVIVPYSLPITFQVQD